MILGTAGHIDHGKTTLVRALTGVDTDRLPEEKRRGITIELGFAPLTLPGLGVAGVVDVPGHEAFVRTMLAGATGIDAALLVIAADEGVMPQTREHLAILGLLQVDVGVVALTKRDLVDDDWLALVTDDVRAALAGTPFAAAPIIPVSATTGAGLGELTAAIGAALRAATPRDDSDLFRLPIDRVFTVKGTGTVVTGTVWSGRVTRDDIVRLLPGDQTARVRAVQAHGSAIDHPAPGSRIALALAGVDVADIARGQVAVTDTAWRSATLIRGDVRLLPDTLPLGPRARVRFHLGTAEVGGRVVVGGGALTAGDVRPARIVLDAPVVARAGDRFVLRGGSPLATLGGGVVSDPLPTHWRARPWPHPDAAPAQRLGWMLDEAVADGLSVETLPQRIGVRPSDVHDLLASQPDVVVLGARAWHARTIDAACAQLESLVRAAVAAAPLEPGAPLQALMSALAVGELAAAEALRRAVASGSLTLDGGLVRPAGWAPALSATNAADREWVLSRLRRSPTEPPSAAELAAERGRDLLALLRLLEREGVLVAVEPGRWYPAEGVRELARRLHAALTERAPQTPAELRVVLGGSRKFVIPFLEYCDRVGITVRTDAGRIPGRIAVS